MGGPATGHRGRCAVQIVLALRPIKPAPIDAGPARDTIDRFAYLPFGAGPRTCIGSTFALQEATLMLAMVARHFSFQLKPGHVVWLTLQVTLRPANGLPMILRQRSLNGPGHRASAGRGMADA
jgi:hypothetical protein